jgi:hypothetical protein
MNSNLPRATPPESTNRDGSSSRDVARLDQRIAALRETIAAAERKRAGVDAAISSRKSALSRLQAQRVLNASGPAPTSDEK